MHSGYMAARSFSEYDLFMVCFLFLIIIDHTWLLYNPASFCLMSIALGASLSIKLLYLDVYAMFFFMVGNPYRIPH